VKLAALVTAVNWAFDLAWVYNGIIKIGDILCIIQLVLGNSVSFLIPWNHEIHQNNFYLSRIVLEFIHTLHGYTTDKARLLASSKALVVFRGDYIEK
jgi:hypothetical protein